MTGETAATPSGVVAIVGRPNVGKSTLFNRLVGQRRSIVHDMPGVTRDRIHGRVALEGDPAVELIDTGGLVPGDDPIGLNRQVFHAIEESDAVVFLVDGVAGLLPGDLEISERLRRTGKPIVLVINKADVRRARDAAAAEFDRLGFRPTLLVSSEHGAGIADLLEALRITLRSLPELAGLRRERGADPGSTDPAIAIVGRPNVGKSSLLNRLTGTDRAVVSPVPGTTRDPVDSWLTLDDRRFRLVDTAGIRRRAKVTDAPEELAVLFARRQVEQADVCVLVIDASQGVTSGDLGIAGTIWELGRPAVVAMNKWDLLTEESREHLEKGWQRIAEVLSDPPRVNLSCQTGRGVEKLLPRVVEALDASRRGISTGRLNELLAEAVRRHPAPSGRDRPWKLYYATQVSNLPPTFMLFANRALPRSDTYRRYLENSLREALGLEGVPIRLVTRQKREGRGPKDR